MTNSEKRNPLTNPTTMVIDKELQERFRKSAPKQFSNSEQLKKDRELLERFNSSVKNKYIFNPVELLAAQERIKDAEKADAVEKERENKDKATTAAYREGIAAAIKSIRLKANRLSPTEIAEELEKILYCIPTKAEAEQWKKDMADTKRLEAYLKSNPTQNDQQ